MAMVYTQIVYTMATKCLDRDDFKAKVYTTRVHGPFLGFWSLAFQGLGL